MVIVITSTLLTMNHSKPGQPSNPIQIGINEWAGYDPFIIADKLDFFTSNNVSAQVIRFSSTVDSIEALKKGEVHGGGFTLDEAFSLIDSGFNGKIVLIIDYSMGGDVLIGQQDITHVSQLIGKTVGYEGTVVGEFLLDRALDSNKVKKKDIKLINISADNWFATFKDEKVDALVCFNPIATQLLNQQQGNVLFSSADMPFEIIDVLLFSDDFYEDNQPAISRILEAWFDAVNYADKELEAAASIVATEKDISVEQYKAGRADFVTPSLELNLEIMDARSEENIYKYSQVVVDFMLDKSLLLKRIATTDLFHSGALKAVDTHLYSQGEGE